MKSVFRHILEILKISLIRMKSLQEILIELLNIVETKIYITPPILFYPGKLGASSRLLRVDYYGTAGVSCVDDCDVDDCDYLAEG